MIDQPDNTRATAYVDDGELHEGTWCTCFACGNPDATRIADAGFAWCRACSRLHPDIHGEYRRRVSNQFAKIFPSLREEPKVGRVEEPTIIRLLRDGLNEPPEPGVSLRKITILIDDDADRVAAKAWLDRHPSRPEPPPAAPIPSVQGDGKAGEASETIDRVRRILGLPIGAEVLPTIRGLRGMQRDAEQDRDRLRHSVNEQQGEIARLREELGKTEKLSASEEYRALREAHADRDAYRRECNNLRCELAKAKERSAELEKQLSRGGHCHADDSCRIEPCSCSCIGCEASRRPSQNELFLCDENASLQKELRDERERILSASAVLKEFRRWLLDARETELPKSLRVASGLAQLEKALGALHHGRVEQPPTASAKEGEDKCAKCAGSGRMWDNGDKCACDDCNGTGKTPTVESGAEVAPVMAAPKHDLVRCDFCHGKHPLALNGEPSISYIRGHGVHICEACVDVCAEIVAENREKVEEEEEPVPQPSAAEQPTPLTNEQAQASEPGHHSPGVRIHPPPWDQSSREPAPVGGGSPYAIGLPDLSMFARPERDYLECAWLQGNTATRALVLFARSERLTGEHDAREGKANG